MECCLECGKVFKPTITSKWVNLGIGHFFQAIILGVPKLPFKGFAKYTKCPRCKVTKVLEWVEDDLHIRGKSIKKIINGKLFMSN